MDINTLELGKSLGYLLSKTQRKLRNYFQKKLIDESIDITVEQWSVLAAINSSKITQSEIATRIGKDKTNVTRMIDLLEKKELIQRVSNPNDRRSYYLGITDNGIKVVNRIIPIANEVNRVGMLGFSIDEENFLIESLKKVWENFDLA